MTADALSLLADCPLPGCRNQVPADDPGTPCGECSEMFGGWLRPAGTQAPGDIARLLAERDQAVRAAYALQAATAAGKEGIEADD